MVAWASEVALSAVRSDCILDMYWTESTWFANRLYIRHKEWEKSKWLLGFGLRNQKDEIPIRQDGRKGRLGLFGGWTPVPWQPCLVGDNYSACESSAPVNCCVRLESQGQPCLQLVDFSWCGSGWDLRAWNWVGSLREWIQKEKERPRYRGQTYCPRVAVRDHSNTSLPKK